MDFHPHFNQLTPAVRELRKNQTDAERYFWSNVLKKPPFDHLRWNRQKPLARFSSKPARYTCHQIYK